MNTTGLFLKGDTWDNLVVFFFYRTATDVKRAPHKVTVSTIFSHLAPICPASHYQQLSQCLLKLSLTGCVCVCVVFVRKRCRNWTGGWRTSTVSWGSLSWAGSTWRSPTRSCWASHRYFFNTAKRRKSWFPSWSSKKRTLFVLWRSSSTSVSVACFGGWLGSVPRLLVCYGVSLPPNGWKINCSSVSGFLF